MVGSVAAMWMLVSGSLAPTWASLQRIGVAVVILVFAAAVNRVATVLLDGPESAPLLVVLLDTAGVLILIAWLDGPFGEEVWSLLLLPVLMAAIIDGPRSIACAMAAGIAGYWFLGEVEMISLTDGVETLSRRIGITVVLSSGIAVLSTWVRRSWEVQEAIRSDLDHKHVRAIALENAIHKLHSAKLDAIAPVLAQSVLDIGFDAATVLVGGVGGRAHSIGDERVIGEVGDDVEVGSDEVAVTVWLEGRNEVAHSAMSVIAGSEDLLVGWSASLIDEAMATSLGVLTNAVAAESLSGSAHMPHFRFSPIASSPPPIPVEHRRS